MIPMSLIVLGVIAALMDKEFIEKHIVSEIDPDDENF